MQRFWLVIFPTESQTDSKPGTCTCDRTGSPSKIPTESPTDLKYQIRTGNVTGAPLKITKGFKMQVRVDFI